MCVCVGGTEQRVGTRSPRGHHCESLRLARARPGENPTSSHRGALGPGGDPAGSPSAAANPGRDGDRQAAGGGAAPPPCPAPAARFSWPKDRHLGVLTPQKTTCSPKPHRPAARLADVLGDAGLTRAGLGEWEGTQIRLPLWHSAPLHDQTAQSEPQGGSRASAW